MTASRMRAALALILSATAVTPAAATSENPWTLLSPWTLNRSGYFFQSTVSYRSSEDYYDFIGEKQSAGQSLREITTNLHLEYGLRNTVGLVFGLPIRNLHVDQTTPPDLKAFGIGDITGGARFHIATDPVMTSAQVEIKLPTGYNKIVQTPALGEGQVDYTGRLLLGKSLPSIHGFAQASGGYKYRTDGPANQFLFNADAGSWVGKTLLEAHWEWLKHSGDGTPYDQFQGGVTARYRALKLFDFLGGLFQTFGGQNAQAGTQFFLGFTTRGNRLSKVEGPLAASLSETPLPPPPPPARAGAAKPDTTAAPPPAAPPPVEPTPAVPDTTPTPTPKP